MKPPPDNDPQFRKIVSENYSRILNLCYHYVHNSEDAEDITQEVFVTVHQNLGDFRDESSLGSWIYRIAVNRSLDFLRRQKRKKRSAVIISLFGRNEEFVESLQYREDPGEADHLSRKLKKVVDTLGDSQKTAVILTYYEDLSHQETARIMGLSVPAVEGLLHRARRNLEKKMKKLSE